MRKIFLILFIFLALLSCKSTYTCVGNKNANYIPYYLEVNSAMELYHSKEDEKCFKKLDSLFNYYEPKQTLFINELDIYFELAYKYKNKSKLKKIINILITEYGYNIEKDTSKLIKGIKKLSGVSNKKLTKKFNIYQNKLKPTLIDSLYEMLKFDQLYRNEKNIIRIDSIDKVNEKKLREIFKAYGFPTFKLTGGLKLGDKFSPSTMSVLLKHISESAFYEFEPFLFEQLKAGRCEPFVYAGMIDHKITIDQIMIPFTYLGSYRNIKPKNKEETNMARLKIGLPPLK